MATINANHVNSATSLDTQSEGHHERRKRRQILELVVTIIRPV